MVVMRDEDQRFWEKVDRNGPVPAHCPELGPCWIWTASRNDGGYGSFKVDGKHGRAVLAHRYAYESRVAPLVDGQCALHRCDNPPCCNPLHLFGGSRDDNNKDRASKM